MPQKGEVLLEVKDMCKNFGVTVALNHVDFVVKRGEIRGLIGENGSGKSTVSSIAAGIQKATSGEMFYKGKPWNPASTLEAQSAGICMIVQEAGTIPDIPVADNIFLGHEKMFAKGPFVNHARMVQDHESVGLPGSIRDNIASTGYKANRIFGPIISFKKEKAYVDKEIKDLSLKCASQYHMVNTLSGGNKQKVVFGKWIGADSRILILDCPTRGIDIGVKAAMYQLIYKMKKEGRSILLISEELPELIGMSDRILIMKDGQVVHETLRSENPTEHDLIEYMI